jgi:hypothetical protein
MGTDSFSNTSVPAAYWSIDATVQGLGGSTPSVTLQAVGTATITLTGTASKAGDILSVTAPASYGPAPFSATALFGVPDGLVLQDQFGDYLVVSSAVLSAGETLEGTASFGQYAGGPTSCLAAGTPIATRRGRIPVERLRPGDIAILATGGRARIAWIGWRLCVLRQRPEAPVDVHAWPVVFAAGCLQPRVPRHDVVLSPDHAVYIRDRLVPAHLLVNGATIRRHPVARVTYYHVELATHGILDAAGMPVESFLDTGNRDVFDSAVGASQTPPGQDVSAWDDKAFAPLLTEGPVLAEIRAALLERAALLGHRLTREPALSVRVDGRVVAHIRESDGITLNVPPHARSVVFESSSARPCDMFPANSDHRELGLAVAEVSLNDTPLPLDDETRFLSGWHRLEDTFRWTNGNAVLQIPCFPVPTTLHVKTMPWMRYWS